MFVDYNLGLESTKDFFATVQDKLLYAVTGQTAAEFIPERVNSSKYNMGLTVTDHQANRAVFC